MRVAVYDRYWPTAGGGEKFAGGVAQVLAGPHDVTLIGHEPIDTDWLGERLALDLSQVAVETIAPGRLERASAAHDLLINLSYRSNDRNGAPHGIYVAHFPHDPFETVPPRQRDLLRKVGPLVAARRPPYELRGGFYDPDVVRASKVWWTDGEAHLAVHVRPGRRTTVRLLFSALIGGGLTIPARVLVDGHEQARLSVGGASSRRDVLVPTVATVEVVGHADGSPVDIEIRSDTWVPAQVLGNDDVRQMGVPLTGVMVGASPAAAARAYASLFDAYPPPVTFLDTYDRVLANSVFTQRWIRTYWHHDADVLYPPVGLRTPADPDHPGAGKLPLILSVGRFFAAERGHSKKQIELVRAFRLLRDRARAQAIPGVDDWSLHLVGGCSDADRPYLDDVRAEAAGLPVELHVDASGDEVDRLYRSACIYWHAAGFGEDAEAHPDRMEHFGITTVEAMSAGAVPVAFGAAGPLEAFTHGVEGFHFHTLEGLADHTVTLWRHPALLARMRIAAIATAHDFGMDAFGERVRAVVDDVTAAP